MDGYLSPEILKGLQAARLRDEKRKSKLRVQSSDQEFRVLSSWDSGFALEDTDHPHLRGVVDLYEGPRHVSHCLIIHSRAENGRIIYEFKRATPPTDRPASDFAAEAPVIAGLLT